MLLGLKVPTIKSHQSNHKYNHRSMRHKLFQILFPLCFLFLANTIITSCGTSSYYSSGISSNQAYLYVKVFQTIGEFEGLAKTEHGDIILVVDRSDEIYDGKVIRGNFERHGTYTYTSIVDDREFQRTVPVFEKVLRSYPSR